MERKVINEFVIQPAQGRAFEVKKGQALRIYQIERKQVAACAFFNAHDPKEVYHIGKSWTLNGDFGSFIDKKGLTLLYSKPPRENLMLKVLEDTADGHNHGWPMGGKCTGRMFELCYGMSEHKSCLGILEEALAPHGVTGDHIMDVFNCFMNGRIDEEGYYNINVPTAKPGDYIEFRAEIDLLIGVAACPNDIDATNDRKLKPIGVSVTKLSN